MAKINLQQDISEVRKKYPNLVLNANGVSIEGKISICKKNGEIITEYEVRIVYLSCFPFCYPKVFELKDRIPHEIDRHINVKDGSICLAVRPVERLRCASGITTTTFIEEILIPHLASQYLFDCGIEDFINGGYQHYNDGVKQFYFELFDTKEWPEVEKGFAIALNNSAPNRNDLCYCGKTAKYKNCHLNAIETLKKLGNEYLKKEILELNQ